MKRKKVWRYYCEHCKKSGGSGGHIKRHEGGCTANPDRTCQMCKMVEGTQKPMDELVAVFDGWKWSDECMCDDDPELKKRVDRLEALTDGCPACMLAAARRVKALRPDGEASINIDYKQRREQLWADWNDAQAC